MYNVYFGDIDCVVLFKIKPFVEGIASGDTELESEGTGQTVGAFSIYYSRRRTRVNFVILYSVLSYVLCRHVHHIELLNHYA